MHIYKLPLVFSLVLYHQIWWWPSILTYLLGKIALTWQNGFKHGAMLGCPEGTGSSITVSSLREMPFGRPVSKHAPWYKAPLSTSVEGPACPIPPPNRARNSPTVQQFGKLITRVLTGKASLMFMYKNETVYIGILSV